MSALAKVFVVFVFMLSILFFGTSATLYLTREDWAKNYDEFKEEVTKSVDELKDRNETLKGERDDLEDALRLVSEDELQKAGTIQKLRNELKGKNAQIANIEAKRDEAINAKTATDNVNASLVSQHYTGHDCLNIFVFQKMF